MKLSLVFIITLFLSHVLQAQLVDDMDDESRLYAENKQVNQFFRRFNGEEDEKGERYYPKDRQYRSERLRRKYIGILFDASNSGIAQELKVQFAKDVLNKDKPVILNFHGGNWFSEVHTTFVMNGKDVPVTLFMELEKHHQGTRWVIGKVYADIFKASFDRDTVKVGKFLHPLSHELDFMNLRKAFSNADSVGQFTLKKFVPDHLSVFLYEVKKGNLKFRTVNEVKFHFFQIDGWYFEVSQFNRSGYNTGWLISNLVKVKNESEKNLLRKYVYYETK
ncbi:MAG TPA: hypothetical protein VJ799_03820 [Nitrososphaeraceae archaeon]|jgi:hypothetical protein|nr:hypothetical protein [Nitrososphaeraceae archaeon]